MNTDSFFLFLFYGTLVLILEIVDWISSQNNNNNTLDINSGGSPLSKCWNVGFYTTIYHVNQARWSPEVLVEWILLWAVYYIGFLFFSQ